jgi:hypothetical protein
MSGAYQYFVEPNYDGGAYTGAHANAKRLGLPVVDRQTFDGLWRGRDDAWEYFSLLDHRWHPECTADFLLPSGARAADWPFIEPFLDGPDAPEDDPFGRVPISADRAAQLMADSRHFTRYWVQYSDNGQRYPGVHRAVSDPGHQFESFFGRTGRWSDTSPILKEFLTAGAHEHANLVEVGPEEAERLIQQEFGISGATQSWPSLDPAVVRFVVTATEVVDGHRDTRVTGRLEHGKLRPGAELWWQKDHYGTGYRYSHHLPVLGVEIPVPGSTERNELTLVLDHPGIDLQPGQTLFTLRITNAPTDDRS